MSEDRRAVCRVVEARMRDEVLRRAAIAACRRKDELRTVQDVY